MEELNLILGKVVPFVTGKGESADQALSNHERVAGIGAQAKTAGEGRLFKISVLNVSRHHWLAQLRDGAANRLAEIQALEAARGLCGNAGAGVQSQRASLFIDHKIEIGIKTK